MRLRYLFLLLVFLWLISFGVRALHYYKGWEKFHLLFFYENRPLMVGTDAYYYLRLTREYLEHHYSLEDELRLGAKRPFPPPFLVCLSAWLSRFTNVHYQWIAFFLPAILGSLMVIPLFLWGRSIGNLWIGILTALIGTTNYYWYTRTALGRFDTDSLLPFFVFIIPYVIWHSHFARWPFYKIGVILLILGIFYMWWWPVGRLSLIPLVLTSYGGLFWFVSKREKIIRFLLFLSSALLLPFVIYPHLWLFAGQEELIKLRDHIYLLLGLSYDYSISELQGADWGFLTKFLGHPSLLLFACLGFLALIFRKYKFLAVLLWPLILALLAFKARRFSIYLVPFFALSVSYFVFVFYKRLLYGKLIAVVLGIFLVFLNAQKTCTKTVVPLLNSFQASLVNNLATKTPSQTLVWCWWDYGYFVQFFGKRPTFIDPGSQTSLRIFIISQVLSAHNPYQAANLMYFFSEKGAKEISAHSFQNLTKFWNFINEKISSMSLNPSRPLALFIPNNILAHSSWTKYSFGQKKTYQKRISRFLLKDFHIDKKQGLIYLPKGSSEFLKDLYYLYFNPWPYIKHHISYPHTKGLIAYQLLQFPFTYIFDPNTAQSLTVKLLLNSPRETPPFQLLAYKPLQGGVWLVFPGGK